MKAFFSNAFTFALLTFLLGTLIWGYEMASYNTFFMSVFFCVSHLTTFRYKRHDLRQKSFSYPIIIALLSFSMIVLTGLIYIPVLSSTFHFISGLFPLGHFGYLTLFVFSGMTAVYSVVLIGIVTAIHA